MCYSVNAITQYLNNTMALDTHDQSQITLAKVVH